jgi:cytochrome bd ubiquinol oxidase subunit II
MLDFSAWIDLPLVWGALIAIAVFLYVFLDGFDLGCGILFPFAPSDACRNKMMNSIAPFWDGNETWLVLGGGGLFAAFPVAYAIIMPALYLPIIFMLLGLIFRGVAFEFRFKTTGRDRKLWDVSFHIGSMLATFMQGVILGNFVQGITVEGRSFAGGPLDWANGFAVTVGIILIFSYALLGATWLIMKTDGQTQVWARRCGRYIIHFVALGMALVSICMPFIDPRINDIWFTMPNFLYLMPVPIITFLVFLRLWHDLYSTQEVRPFLLTIMLFLLGYFGLGVSVFPWVVPFKFTIWDAAAASTSQSLLLVGTLIFLPIILTYTAFSYYLFRGKVDDKSHY